MKLKTIFLSLLMIFILWAPALAVTHVGVSIESHAELWYSSGVVTSETSITTVEQIHGITVEPVSGGGRGIQWVTYYFHHTISNLGNGTDYARLRFVPTGETWSYKVIEDSNRNCIPDSNETWEVYGMPLGEDAIQCFFVAITAPTAETNGSWRAAHLVGTGEGHDGGYYTGADAIIYGGPDTIEVTDVLTVDSAINLRINRDDATGKIYITWNGGTADIYYIQGTFDATFAKATQEVFSPVSSPYYCSVEAKDGITRYYKVKLTGRSTTEDVILGKFDVPVRVGLNELSSPLVLYKNDPASIVGRQVVGAGSANNADRIWKYNPAAQGGYDYAWLVGGVGPPYDGQWYTGSTPTTMTIGTDEGYVLEIRTGHTTVPYITMVGEVSRVNRTVPIVVGMNFIGTCFPVEITLEASNLWQSGMKGAGSANNADRIWKYNPAAQGGYDIAWLVDGVNASVNGKWYTGSTPTKLTLLPGYGYRIEIRSTHSAFTWTYKKPY